jgi:lipopolysaccharide export system permease protein|tara:strand:- start:262 stop:1332 length:1071 start_codon:yes stop_codon:yes gene_type:complete
LNILLKYLIGSILKGTFLVLLILLSITALYEFISQLGNLEANFGVLQAFLFAILRLPQLSFEMLPIATLIGSLFSLGQLASKSELIIIQTAGISIDQIAKMVCASGLFIVLFAILMGEFVGPSMDYYARNMRDEARYSNTGVDFGNAVWIKDDQAIMRLERVNTDYDFGSIYIYRFNPDGSLMSIAVAENSGIDRNEDWVLNDFRETRFEQDRVVTSSSEVVNETFDLNSDLLGVTLVKPISLSVRELIGYVDYLKKNELFSSRYEIELWSRISAILTILLMPILALAFVFGSLREVGSGARLVLGLVVGLVYFLMSELIFNYGQVYNINPIITAWIPPILLTIYTGFRLSNLSRN